MNLINKLGAWLKGQPVEFTTGESLTALAAIIAVIVARCLS